MTYENDLLYIQRLILQKRTVILPQQLKNIKIKKFEQYRTVINDVFDGDELEKTEEKNEEQ